MVAGAWDGGEGACDEAAALLYLLEPVCAACLRKNNGAKNFRRPEGRVAMHKALVAHVFMRDGWGAWMKMMRAMGVREGGVCGRGHRNFINAQGACCWRGGGVVERIWELAQSSDNIVCAKSAFVWRPPTEKRFRSVRNRLK
jgi:hypothetical protein